MVTEPKAVIEELFRRRASGDDSVIDEFIAENMVNHAAGPQGREGWKQILAVIATDLGDDIAIENHRFIAEGEFVAQHMTLHGRHRASTMPLLAGVKPNDLEASWTYIHIWRVVDGKVVEHWACRDDVGLLRQLGAWPTPTP
jgi:lactoylglutathione lyase